MNMIGNIRIGAKIPERRIKAKLSQGELGDALGRSHAAISDIETGKTNCTIYDLSAIADLLKVPIADCFEIRVRECPTCCTTVDYQGVVSKQIRLGGSKLNIISNQLQTPQAARFDSNMNIEFISLSKNASYVVLTV